MPTKLAGERGEFCNAREHRGGEAGFGLAYGRNIHADAAHAKLVPLGEFAVGGRSFVEVDDAAPERRVQLAHRVEHAGIVETIGARLHEDEALEAEAARELEVSLERRVRGLVA